MDIGVENNIDSQETDPSQEWQEQMRQTIQEGLDNYELFEKVVLSHPVADLENDDQVLLNPQELNWANQELLRLLKIEGDFDITDSYTFITPNDSPDTSNELEPPIQDEVQVTICRTPREKEDMFLHILTRSDGSTEYMVAPRNYRL